MKTKTLYIYKLRQTGDTIVEVLIALAVIAAVLAGAYVTSNRSLNNTRDAQERGEALKIVEAQQERLKVVAQNSSSAVFTTPKLFCLDNSNNVVLNQPNSSLVPSLDSDVFGSPTNYDSSCIRSQNGSNVNYYVSIQRDSAQNNLFTTRVRWDKVGGNGRNEVKIVYKVLQ